MPVRNGPFRFLERPGALDELRAVLAAVGIESVWESEDREDTLVLSCSWVQERMELRWVHSWWPDGVRREDDAVQLFVGDRLRGEVAMRELRDRRPGIPLARAVSEGLACHCAEVTGKRRRPSGRVSEEPVE